MLLLGPSGAGKSDLALRLIGRGFVLVADDQVLVADGIASAPPALAGLLEVRGLGIMRLSHCPAARLVLAADLAARPDRLPAPARHAVLGLPLLGLDPVPASAPDRLILALDCALGRASQLAGAFAA